MNSTTTDFAATIYDAFGRRDFDTCLANATDDVTVDFVPLGMVFEGKQGFLDFMRSFAAAFSDMTVTIRHQTEAGDVLVNECAWDGTHDGPLQGPEGEIPPTGRRVQGARFCEVWEIRDDKIAAIRNYQDVGSWMRQLGLI